jgi:hypothetical protein
MGYAFSIVHVASMLIGDEIELETGSRFTPNFEQYNKVLLRGAGISKLMKIPMLI